MEGGGRVGRVVEGGGRVGSVVEGGGRVGRDVRILQACYMSCVFGDA